MSERFSDNRVLLRVKKAARVFRPISEDISNRERGFASVF